jgi:hypothetical protein
VEEKRSETEDERHELEASDCPGNDLGVSGMSREEHPREEGGAAWHELEGKERDDRRGDGVEQDVHAPAHARRGTAREHSLERERDERDWAVKPLARALTRSTPVVCLEEAEHVPGCPQREERIGLDDGVVVERVLTVERRDVGEQGHGDDGAEDVGPSLLHDHGGIVACWWGGRLGRLLSSGLIVQLTDNAKERYQRVVFFVVIRCARRTSRNFGAGRLELRGTSRTFWWRLLGPRAQVVGWREDENTLDGLPEVRPEVSNVTRDQVRGFVLEGGQEDGAILLVELDPAREWAVRDPWSYRHGLRELNEAGSLVFAFEVHPSFFECVGRRDEFDLEFPEPEEPRVRSIGCGEEDVGVESFSSTALERRSSAFRSSE